MTPGEVLAESVVVILVEPQHPGNVGAVARAMKNMGLRRLVLVRPPAYDPERARWMAPGCADMLQSMRIVATLDEALEGVERVYATTARHRRYNQPVVDTRTFASQVFEAPERTTAVLFGREDHGLSRDEVFRSGSLLRIATPDHASLNLSQAVLVIAHDLFEEARQQGMIASGRIVHGRRTSLSTRALQRADNRDRGATVTEAEPAIEELVALLARVGYTRGNNPTKVGVSAREVLQRAAPTLKQIEALRGMVNRIQWALDHPESDWSKRRQPKILSFTFSTGDVFKSIFPRWINRRSF